jgi:hypothetical protein
MKKKLLKIILPLCGIALAARLFLLAVTFGQTGNTLSWDYDITNDQLCSVTKPDVCVTGFDLAYTVGTSASIIAARVPVSACVLAGRKARATLQHHQPQ